MRISYWSSACALPISVGHFIAERRFSLNTFCNEVPDSLDAQMINDTKAVFERGEKMQLTYTVRNTHRAVGTRLSARITATFGMSTLADGHVHVRLRGRARKSAGSGRSVSVREGVGGGR